MKIRTCLIAVFCCFIFLYNLVFADFLACAADKELQQEISEDNSWWPIKEINPPELEAFYAVLYEKTDGSIIGPEIKFDPATVLVEAEPEIILSSNGRLTGFSISVVVLKRIKNRYVYRRFWYHNVWVADIEEIFYDLSFLNRTIDENKKLALSDNGTAYENLVKVSAANVKQEAVDTALKACRAISTNIAKGLAPITLEHSNLDLFARHVDHYFSQAFEPYMEFGPYDPVTYILVFDYDLWSANTFLLKIARVFLVPSSSGTVLPLFGREQFVAKVVSTDTHSVFGNTLAKQIFRAILALHDGERK